MVSAPSSSPRDLNASVSVTLTHLGVPAHLSGYMYLQDAMLLLLDAPRQVVHICRDIYPVIASKYGTTPGAVERNMRTAITQVWLRGGEAAWVKFTGQPGPAMGQTPTNSEFLMELAEFLRRRAC